MHPATRSSRNGWIAIGIVLAAGIVLGCQPPPRLETSREFEARLRELVGLKRFGSADSLIAVRARLLPDDAEVFVARGNLYFRMAQSSMSNAAAGLPGVADSAGGRGATHAPDTLLLRRSVDAIDEAIRRHPERLDVRFGLAFIYQQIGDPVSEIAVLREAILFARQHPDTLRWSYGEPLPSPPDEFVPQALHDYVTFYLNRAAPGDDGPMLAIARMSAEAYPSNNRSTNDVAYYYGARGDWKRSLEFLQRAEQSDSTDALVLYNLGWAHENLGHRDQAARYYRRAQTSGDAGRMSDIAQSARDGLARLAAKNP